MKPVIVVTHAAFDEHRKTTLARLMAQLAGTGLDAYVIHDEDRMGSLWCWRAAMRMGLETDATHIVWLPDDAILCEGFGPLLRRHIESNPKNVFDCYTTVTNHDFERAGWYTTPDGYVGLGGCMPRELLVEHLEWRDEHLVHQMTGQNGSTDVANDLGVNLWAMATGRVIYKTTRTLVQHDDSVPSLDGNGSLEHGRTGELFLTDEAQLGDLSKVVRYTRTYTGNHWMVLQVAPEQTPEIIERVYGIERRAPVADKPTVCIATPAYKGAQVPFLESLTATANDLTANGFGCVISMSNGDSLVTRGRHSLMHVFLKTPCTHMLFWDSDIECQDPTAVRKMLEADRDVVGGAYPFRDGSFRVVGNGVEEGKPVFPDEHYCIEVGELGTGFLLISRKAVVEMCAAYPDTFYVSDEFDAKGEPRWALFDVAIKERRYLSEDYLFCQRWRDMGGKVWCYTPPRFKHWGLHAHEGHVMEAWRKPAEAAE